jgi:hypothetical protein
LVQVKSASHALPLTSLKIQTAPRGVPFDTHFSK